MSSGPGPLLLQDGTTLIAAKDLLHLAPCTRRHVGVNANWCRWAIANKSSLDMIRAKASQSPTESMDGAWWVHRLPNHISKTVLSTMKVWWATLESNQGPQSYQDCALTD